MVVETLPDGDLRICFSGLTGGYSASGVLKLNCVAFMEPEIEIPLVFQCWERWLQEAGICDSIADIDFIEMHAFATQPKSPNPQLDPVGYQAELERLRSAYALAYRNFFRQHCPENGLPARFTVHVVDVPDQAAITSFTPPHSIRKRCSASFDLRFSGLALANPGRLLPFHWSRSGRGQRAPDKRDGER